MNNGNKILWLTLTVLSVLAVQARAEGMNMGESKIQKSGMESPLAVLRSTERPAVMSQAGHLIGSEVHNYQGDKIGTVKDIALDRNSERVSYLVLATGGFMGFGEKHIAVPLQAVRTDISEGMLTVNLSKAALAEAPKLSKNWPVGTDAELRKVNNFFALHSTEFNEWLQKQPAAGREMAPQAQQLASEDEKWLRRAGNLVGIGVKNMQNRSIGELTDLVFDMSTGKVMFGLLDIRNIEGLENQMAACPWSSINVLPQERIAKIDASDATLRSVAFRSGNTPDLSNRLYVNTIYKQFDQEPYWATYGYEGEEKPRQKPEDKRLKMFEEDMY